MLISVFTPSHDPRFLDDCFESLLNQTFTDWEWVVLLNVGARWQPPHEDDRVRIVMADYVSGVGFAKRMAVENCTGDVLVELDHDDLLLSDALTEVAKAFTDHPDAGMVYSQHATIDEDGAPTFVPFGSGHGWRYKQAYGYTFPQNMEPTPHNVSHIWYAPNHLRAFSRIAYDKTGGYSPSLDILDDQDLMARLYLVGPFVEIDRLLYLQRSHSGNTQKNATLNERIQQETLWMYDRTFAQAAVAWALREGLPCLDLGGVHGKPDGYLSVDEHNAADIVHTFPEKLMDWEQESVEYGFRKFRPASSVGVIRASDFLEHVADKVAMMNEIHRLLVPGGVLLTNTPSSEGWGADQDPTHVSRWNPNSFWYYSDPNFAAYVPQSTARFQTSRITHGFPSQWHAENNIPYVTANLLAAKPGMPRNGGTLLWDTE